MNIVSENDLGNWPEYIRRMDAKSRRQGPIAWRCRNVHCQAEWTARMHAHGWNRCPTCGHPHTELDMLMTLTENRLAMQRAKAAGIPRAPAPAGDIDSNAGTTVRSDVF